MSGDGEIPGLVRLPSQHSVAATLDRLESSLKQRGILVFARIDFCGDAARAGLHMRPEQLLIFGNPRAGTPLMVQAPEAGLDLPLKVLAWEDTEAKVWVAYNDPAYIMQRFAIDAGLTANLTAVVPIIEAATAG